MVTIRPRIIGNQTYYYLEHTVRHNKTVEKREKYLGKKIPRDVDAIKAEFLYSLYRSRWAPPIQRIKKAYELEKKEIPKSAVEEEMKKFSIKFTYNTQRIEGSMLTFRETADLLERGITPKSRPVRDIKEAEAHEAVFYEMLNTTKDISLSLVLYWHKRLLEHTKPDIAGKIRRHQVAISGSKFMPPSPVEVYPLLQDFFRWHGRSKKVTSPVELAALVHLKFVTIHPFADGNGRISRLLMNFVLYKNNFPLLNIPYEGRSSYYGALERSQVKRLDFVFVQWFVKRYIKEYSTYLK